MFQSMSRSASAAAQHTFRLASSVSLWICEAPARLRAGCVLACVTLTLTLTLHAGCIESAYLFPGIRLGTLERARVTLNPTLPCVQGASSRPTCSQG